MKDAFNALIVRVSEILEVRRATGQITTEKFIEEIESLEKLMK